MATLNLDPDKFRLSTLRRRNPATLADFKALVHLASNDDATLAAAINAIGFLKEATITAEGNTTVTYDNGSGAFTVAETVTDNVTGATGVVVSDSGTVLVLSDVTGQFNDDDDIEGGTSLETADVDGNSVYATIDLTINLASAKGATVFILASASANLAIGNFTNAPIYPFKVIASGVTVFEVINGTVKTKSGLDVVLKGSTGDFANFETRSSVIKETSAVIYA